MKPGILAWSQHPDLECIPTSDVWATPYPHQHFVLSVMFLSATLTCVVVTHRGFNLHSPVANVVEYLFICLFFF